MTRNIDEINSIPTLLSPLARAINRYGRQRRKWIIRRVQIFRGDISDRFVPSSDYTLLNGSYVLFRWFISKIMGTNRIDCSISFVVLEIEVSGSLFYFFEDGVTVW